MSKVLLNAVLQSRERELTLINAITQVHVLPHPGDHQLSKAEIGTVPYKYTCITIIIHLLY